MDQAPRHFFEKKLHFSVAKKSRNKLSKKLSKESNGGEDGGNNTFYTYISSCKVAPQVPGKKSFLNFSMSVDESAI